MVRYCKQAVINLVHHEHFIGTCVLAIVLILFSSLPSANFFSRFFWTIVVLFYVEQTFPKTSDQSKLLLLMDALVVPYNRKDYIASHLLSVLFMSLPVFIIISFITGSGKNDFISILLYDFLVSSMFVTSLLFYSLSTQNQTSKMELVISYIFGLCFVFANMLFVPVLPLILLCASSVLLFLYNPFDRKKQESEKNTPVITKNQKGVLILSKMSIVKRNEYLEALNKGGYGYLFYYLIRILHDVTTGSFAVTSVYKWSTVMLILLCLSIFTSINALRRIYTAKSMLKIVPISKQLLFSTCASLALKPLFLALTAMTAVAFLIYHESGFNLFFNTSHPVEMILNGMILATIPVAVFLTSFTIYASKNRGLIGFILIISAILGTYLLLLAGAIIQVAFIIKIIFLVLIIVLPYLSASFCYRKMVNIHV